MDKPTEIQFLIQVLLILFAGIHVLASDDLLFISYRDTSSKAKIVKSTLQEDGRFEKEEYTSKKLGDPSAISYDPVEKKIYFCDAQSQSIKVLPPSSSEDANILYQLSPVSECHGLIVDAVSRLLYYTDRGEHVIGAIDLKNNNRHRTLFHEEIDDPQNIAISTKIGTMFWVNRGKMPAIMGAPLYGGMTAPIIFSEISDPTGIAIDPDGKKLYWCDKKLNKVESYDIKSGKREIIYSNSDAQPYGLALIRNTLYFTEHLRRTVVQLDLSKLGASTPKPTTATTTTTKTTTTAPTTVVKTLPQTVATPNNNNGTFSEDTSNMTSSNATSSDVTSPNSTTKKPDPTTQAPKPDIETLLMVEIKEFSSSLGLPSGIWSYWGRKEWTRISTKEKGPCSGNKDCSHMCIPLSMKEKICACPDRMVLGSDGKTCKDQVFENRGNHLLFTQRGRLGKPDGSICLLHLKTDGLQCIKIAEDLVANVGPMDYDGIQNKIYWIDHNKAAIMSSKYDGSEVKTEKAFGKNITVLDIAVDPLHEILYFTSEESLSIQLYDIKHNEMGSFIETKAPPVAIVIDHVERYLYWTEWGNTSRMMRVKFGENHPEVSISLNLHRPRGLAISYAKSTLYWCDGDSIESVDLKSGDRKAIISVEESEFTSLSLDMDNIYATDYRSGFLKQISLTGDHAIKPRGTSLSRQLSYVRFITDNPFFSKGRSVDGCFRFKKRESVLVDCYAQHAFTTCHPSCMDKYEFLPSRNVPVYLKCVNEKWLPEQIFPPCIRTDSGNGGLVKGHLYFKNIALNCKSAVDLKEIRQKTRQFLSSTFMKTGNLRVNVNATVSDVTCVEESFRLKRDATTRRGDAKVNFVVRSTSDRESPEKMKKAMDGDVDQMLKGAYYGTMLLMNDKPATLFPWGSEISPAQVTCHHGHEMTILGCKPCKPGRHFNIQTVTCKDCPIDTYQAAEGQEECASCPDGHTTKNKTGVASEEGCIGPPIEDMILPMDENQGNSSDAGYNNIAIARARRLQDQRDTRLHFIIGGVLCLILFITLLILIGCLVRKARSEQKAKRRLKIQKEKEANGLLRGSRPPSFISDGKPPGSAPVQNGDMHNRFGRQMSGPPLAKEEDWFLGESKSQEILS